MADRKRKYNWNHAVKQKNVEAGLEGLLFTVEGLEKLALKEAYNLVDEIVEGDPTICGVDPAPSHQKSDVDEDDDEGDVSDLLKKACSESRDGRTRVFRCRQRPTGVKNCLFVTVKDADIGRLTEKMVEITQKSPRCRYLQRVFPIEATADFDLKKLSDLISKSVAKHLVPDSEGNLPSYALEFKTRNNDSLKKTTVLDILCECVNAIAPLARVDLKNAEVVFFVQLVRKTLMVGAMKKFYEKRKYSLRPNTETGSGDAVKTEREEPRELVEEDED